MSVLINTENSNAMLLSDVISLPFKSINTVKEINVWGNPVSKIGGFGIGKDYDLNQWQSLLGGLLLYKPIAANQFNKKHKKMLDTLIKKRLEAHQIKIKPQCF
ncbi:hypothetical protein LBMAG18_09830 [Alphaproteobacteria bacterium]|nr:hypothetical protein LBMAG18_09830 [Alphaproteobacteria bacterium]